MSLTIMLFYPTYKAQRTYGHTHEQLCSIGLGNEALKERYEIDLLNQQHLS